MHRLVTGQAPWSDAEGWRRQTLPSIDLDSPDTAESHDPKVLEGEPATITEPDEIILWVDSEVLQGESGATRDIVGMGLRGRWGLYGTLDGCHSWWAFKAKDCMSFAFLIFRLTPYSHPGTHIDDTQMFYLPSGSVPANMRKPDYAYGDRGKCGVNIGSVDI
jgi:hypothetical protein